MGLLDNMIKKGISRGVSDAIGKAVEKAVAPKATELANKAAQRIDEATGSAAAAARPVSAERSSLEGAFSNLQRATESYATEAAKNVKVCPACGEATSADRKFCPECGAKLPEVSAADEAVCPSCGKQNTVGTKFCQDCGAKLPGAERQETEQRERDEKTLKRWPELLPGFPVWNCGGCDFALEAEEGYVSFTAKLPSGIAAQNAVKQYRERLQQSGYRPAGQYPDPCHLYRMDGGVCRHVDTEHCFDGDEDWPTLYFNFEEPTGGFNYVKPEPKKQPGLRDLFKF